MGNIAVHQTLGRLGAAGGRGRALVVALMACACGEFPIVVEADDSSLTPSLRAAYLELAEDSSAFMHVGDSSIDLPAGEAESLYNALIHAHHATGSDWPEGRDWFVEDLEYATASPGGGARDVRITVQGSGFWDAWVAGEQVTGDEVVDPLMEQYAVEVSSIEDEAFSDDLRITLRAGEPINTSALADELGQRPGVVDASPDPDWQLWEWGNPLAIGWSSFRPEVGVSAWNFEYQIGWGDCPSGCIHHHRWRLRVKENGKVSVLSSDGDPFEAREP